MKEYLAVDIGASSGRVMLGYKKDGEIKLEELHRFSNGLKKKNGHLVWDLEHLYSEILVGMQKCHARNITPASIGIDTWGVDFVLLDRQDRVLGDAVGYRDSRTAGIDRIVYEKITEEALYARTGIQKQLFNTIYQLVAIKKQNPELLEKANTFLMIPDYLNFLLTGVKAAEYTNASTTQLLNPQTRSWDTELMDLLGIPGELFLAIREPGTILGNLRPEVAEQVGFDCQVVLPATHDTGAAVMTVQTRDADRLYISSGTWSLMGTLLKQANCSDAGREHNFTNEGGYGGRIRFLKNIMGMWMINSAKAELAPDLSFEELCKGAAKESITSVVNVADGRFLAPESMVIEVQRACAETGQKVPESMEEVAKVIYQSLANCYAKTAKEIEIITGKTYDTIQIIGGGSQAEYLNELTEKASGKKVLAGPVEATAMGNVMAQMIAMEGKRC